MTNPFAQPAPMAPAPEQGNPFAQSVPAAPASPFPQQGAPQAYVPAQQQSYVPPMLDASSVVSAPAPIISSGKGPDLVAMFGRLVLIFPHEITRVPRKPEHISAEQRAAGNVMQDQLTATVVVLDMGPGRPGGTIQWGGKRMNNFEPISHPFSDPLPYVRRNMWINASRIISVARGFLPSTPGGQPGMLAGRVGKDGQGDQAPWQINGADAAEMALVQMYINLVRQGEYPHPLAPG